ncbi:META domain-containing protein [Shimia biformata]|uniref:META domain-containing protein n=1 Tax=Shimia biformata TaxID=1294299 RepID=UPI00194FE21F|nr:META domain-containing protein [Shimia biformata]
MRPALLAFFLFSLTACSGDETASRYGAAGKTWALQEIDGRAWTERATLVFDGTAISGQAPCNRYSASQSAPYPWFEVTDLVQTKLACPSLDAENRFLSALTAMRLIEVSDSTLILSDETGREMIFTPAQSGG